MSGRGLIILQVLGMANVRRQRFELPLFRQFSSAVCDASSHGRNAKLVYERGKKSVRRLVKIELTIGLSGFFLPLRAPRLL
jgi:hypothetical protein